MLPCRSTRDCLPVELRETRLEQPRAQAEQHVQRCQQRVEVTFVAQALQQ